MNVQLLPDSVLDLISSGCYNLFEANDQSHFILIAKPLYYRFDSGGVLEHEVSEYPDPKLYTQAYTVDFTNWKSPFVNGAV